MWTTGPESLRNSGMLWVWWDWYGVWADLGAGQITIAIGDEIRDSTALAEKMNDSFDGTRVRLRGTMNRMLRMAERTGVGWKVWLGFFAAVIVLFWYVWLF